MASELKPWRYEIKYGPEGEDAYSWVYDDHGAVVATMKTNKAKQIVDAMNTRPAPADLKAADRKHYKLIRKSLQNKGLLPAATDTGLVTVETQVLAENGWTTDGFLSKNLLPHAPRRALCDRSQADELLAAERAESDRLRKLFKTQSAVHSKHVKELIAKHERERETYGQAAQDFRERAEKAEADNAAKDARVKELEEENKSLTEEWYRGLRVQQKISDRAEALEAKLAAAEKVREAAIELDEAISDDFNIFGAQQKLRAALGGKPS